MSGKYRGFWDPSQLYETGDIVEYYSSLVSDVSAPYAGISSYTYNRNEPTVGACPLKNFTNPRSLSAASAPIEISLSREVLRSFVSDQGMWNSYKYYNAGEWEGPHGLTKAGAKLEDVNSDYWTEGVATEQAEWKDLTKYDASHQEYGSSSQKTLSKGKYDAPNEELSEEFSEVQGETDSDAYYISSVQNYKGNFSDSEEYKKFDIVRSPVSSAFYYARTDITGVEQASTLNFSNIEIREPSDYTYSSNHIATIEYLGDGNSGWVASGESILKVGHTLEFSNFTKALNNRALMVIGVSPDLIWLGSFGTNDKQLAAYERITGSMQVSLSSAQVNIINNDQVWSGDQFFFDPDYGSSVEFSAFNKKFEHGDGYSSVSPFGVNSIRMRFDLEFTNRSNREANAILHFLENNLGQHERQKPSTQLEYDQGISGFRMDGESLFFPYNSTENLTRRFHCIDFSHEIENEDVHTVRAKIENSTASTLTMAHQIFVKEAELWNADKTYNQHEVVFCHDNSKYYYSKAAKPQSGNRPWILEEEDVTSINKNIWTREFYWSPSVPFNVSHSPNIDKFGTAHGPYTQYHPANQQNVNLLTLDLEFQNRSDEEAYAILHFLEMHLGYLSFLFVPPSPYNRKRRFYCEKWKHTYVFRDNHTISATFVQFPLGQNTPLDDDEIDKIEVKVKKKPGRLLMSSDPSVSVNQNYKKASKFYVKIPIELTNDGETDIFIKTISPDQDTNHSNTKFKNLKWGRYKHYVTTGYKIGDQTLSSTSDININGNDSDGVVIYNTNSAQYIHTENGVLYKLETGSEPELLEVAEHKSDVTETPADNKISPGENYKLFCQFNSSGVVSTASRSAEHKTEVSISYCHAPSGEPVFDGSLEYTSGNIVQHLGVVYQANKDVSAGTWTASDWDEYTLTTSVPINVVINPELRDSIKDSVSIEISRFDRTNSTVVDYDIRDNSEAVFTLSQKEKNLFFDIAASLSGEGDRLAVPSSLSDIVRILEVSTDIETYAYLGIKYDSEKQQYYNYSDPSFINNNSSNLEIISEEDYLDLSPSDKANYSRNSVLSFPDIVLDPGEGGDYVALNLKTGNFMHVSENSKVVEGHVIEDTESLSSGSINLSDYISSHEKIEGRSLGELQEINVTLKGLFLSEDPRIPTISTGGGYSDEAELNIYIGTPEEPCEIIGRGGQGGSGMISEGVIYENGQPTEIDSDLNPPLPGGDGGDAIYIDDHVGTLGVNIHLVNGSIFGGGGGGGGGGYQSDFPRIKNYNFVNIGGGGGGGSGHSIGGFPFGGITISTDLSPAKGGQPINNATEYRSSLTKGGDGGTFGEDGQPGGGDGPFGYNRVAAGGSGGKSISWGSDMVPNIFLNDVKMDYKTHVGVLSFYDSGNNPINNLPEASKIAVAGQCLQRTRLDV